MRASKALIGGDRYGRELVAVYAVVGGARVLVGGMLCVDIATMFKSH